MKMQKAQDTAASPPHRRSRFSLRGRKKKTGTIQGRLRIRSMPGAFLLLGLMVLVVGTTLAVAGYWPYRISRSPILARGEEGGISRSPILARGEEGSISVPQASGWSVGAKGLLSTASLVHSERMKLLGPVIMGVGLFILICANTVLYENRDRETQMLLAQMRTVLCSVSAAVPSADLKDMAVVNSMAKHYQWVTTLPAAHLNILCLQQLASSEPLLQTTTSTQQEQQVEGVYQQQAILRTEALHHQESASPPSLHSSHSNSCNSSQTDLTPRPGAGEQEDSGSTNPQPAAVCKLNTCLVSAHSLSTLGGDDWDVPAAQPRRCHSLSYRTNPHAARTTTRTAVPPQEADEGGVDGAQVLMREPGGQVTVDMPGQVVDSLEEHPHRSWPCLDLGAVGRRYLKLENKDDSVDKLLDQMEQQSQWDQSFGSGPFQ